MTTPRTSIATLAVAASLFFFGTGSRADAVPTPAPGGTPVTFGTPATIGSPLPTAPAMPIATSVPTTSPDGASSDFKGSHERFIVGDYLFQPKVYNELSHGQQSTQTYFAARGAAEFNIANLPFMVEGTTRMYSYRHESGDVTEAGGYRAFVPTTNELDLDLSGNLGIKILEPRIYVAGSYLDKRMGNETTRVYGYGAGLEKLPDYGAPLGVYFSVFFYPQVNGQTSFGAAAGPYGTPISTLQYKVLTYQLGFTIDPGHSPVFIDIGALGDRMTRRANAPIGETHLSPYAGIGIFGH